MLDLLDLSRPNPYCVPCLERTDVKHRMEPTTEWHPRLAAYVDAWECPECERTVMRKEGEDVSLTTPSGERF